MVQDEPQQVGEGDGEVFGVLDAAVLSGERGGGVG